MALNLKSYPWNVHKAVEDKRRDPIEAYVASWRYVIATQAASILVTTFSTDISDAARKIRDFFEANYGSPKVDLSKVFAKGKLVFSRATIQPSVAETTVGGLEFESKSTDLGYVIDSVSEELFSLTLEIMKRRGISKIALHFDGLDFGIETLKRERELMIAGLVLAAADIRTGLGGSDAKIQPFVYFREDIWRKFSFSDRNKISYGASLRLAWDADKLMEVLNERIRARTDQKYQFSDVVDDQLMPKKQSKWDYIVSQTHDRPRDIIAYMNLLLENRKNKSDLVSNTDLHLVKDAYSTYFKGELEDEVKAHWPQWEEAVQAIGDIGYNAFEKSEFVETYEGRVSANNAIVDPTEALSALFNYSVIGFLKPRVTGGTDWIWKYK